MLHVALYAPEIPPNTGNVIRLCANTGAHLHLIEPLGFSLDDKQVKRAGLDYHDMARVTLHRDFKAFLVAMGSRRIFAGSAHAQKLYTDCQFQQEDVLLFGPEANGLPMNIRGAWDPEYLIRIPMQSGNRSLNLSNSVAIILYEAWRQLGFIPNELGFSDLS